MCARSGMFPDKMRGRVRYGCPDYVWAKQSNIRSFLVIYSHLMNFGILFSWLVVRRSPSCYSVSYRFL